MAVGAADWAAIAHGNNAGSQSTAVPAWLYPMGQASANAVEPDPQQRFSLPGSRAVFTRAQLTDLNATPDWHPESHAPMPEIVSRGRAPDVYACGYCHSPTGQGRPENAALAGLPAAYIEQQVADFASGARRGAWPSEYRPTDFMVQTAVHVSAEEVERAAAYFSQQVLRPRVRMLETARVPRSQVVGLVYAAVPGAGDEPLGERLLEFAPNPERHEQRDDRLRYIAYVPRGSIARGRSIGRVCGTCHGQALRGIGLVPPLAGRSPSYLLRALFAFRTGARAGAASQPMQAVATGLDLPNLIDVAAYAASLPP